MASLGLCGRSPGWLACWPAACLLAGSPARADALFSPSGELRITDRFNRDLDAHHGITLVDWEGYMANPAIAVNVALPAGAVAPAQVKVTATEPRLYFDLPSQTGPTGPTKAFAATATRPSDFHVSIFPARHKRSFDTAIRVQVTDARHHGWTAAFPVHVTCSQAKPGPAPSTYAVTVDFSQDRTGFFTDQRRQIVRLAVNDWAFYFAGAGLKPVSPGEERTPIFPPTALANDRRVTNRAAYTGFLLYAYGIHTAALRSSGQPSDGGFQSTEDGSQLQLRRSGGVEAEVRGNYNQLGWSDVKDDEWFRATNAAGTAHDFYSIMHHEIGHALIFDAWYPMFNRGGTVADAAVVAYLGVPPRPDAQNHLPGVVDPISLRGAFGNEYGGRMPWGRWIITKTDLLVAQSVGYTLRPVDALQPLSVDPSPLPEARVGSLYRGSFRGCGGVPNYDWALESGSLPSGLSLDRFTGEITGTPTVSGRSSFTVRLRDNAPDGVGVSLPFTLHAT